MTTHIGKDVEKEEHSSIAGGLQTCTTTLDIILVVPQKMEIDLPEEPSIPLLDIYPKDILQGHMFYYVHIRLLCDGQKLETTQMPHDRRMDTENVVHLYNGILLSN